MNYLLDMSFWSLHKLVVALHTLDNYIFIFEMLDETRFSKILTDGIKNLRHLGILILNDQSIREDFFFNERF